jgi:hypothetical protein
MVEDFTRHHVPCDIHDYHSPDVHVAQVHHILPISWGGPTVPDNLTHICATGHDLVHELLNLYVRFDGEVPWEAEQHFGTQERKLAQLAWQARTPGRTPYTASLAVAEHAPNREASDAAAGEDPIVVKMHQAEEEARARFPQDL